MSVQITIRCDGKPGGTESEMANLLGCPSEGHPTYRWHDTATKIRRYLRKFKGWHRTKDGRDICPQCWEEGVHKGAISPNWCAACDERKPCGCDDAYALPDEDDDGDAACAADEAVAE